MESEQTQLPADPAQDNEEEGAADQGGEIDVEQMDENVFKQETDLLGIGAEKSFTCTDPQIKSGHVVYKCRGVDKDGAWEGERRYREFHRLHEELVKRWPGIPVPQIPPKKNFGNKDVKFINERRFYLERFLKKMASFEFVLNSEEFKCFSRPAGDIDKQLTGLPKQTTT